MPAIEVAAAINIARPIRWGGCEALLLLVGAEIVGD
jgi:hypothetical protein